MLGALVCIPSESARSMTVSNGQYPKARLAVPGFAHSSSCARGVCGEIFELRRWHGTESEYQEPEIQSWALCVFKSDFR